MCVWSRMTLTELSVQRVESGICLVYTYTLVVRPVCAGCQVNSPRWKCSPWPCVPIRASFTAIGARLHGDVRAVKGRQGSVRGKSPAFCRRRGASRAVSVRKLWPSNRLGERRILGLPSCAPERATGSTGDRDASVRKLTPFLKTFWRHAPLPLPLPPYIPFIFLLKKGLKRRHPGHHREDVHQWS